MMAKCLGLACSLVGEQQSKASLTHGLGCSSKCTLCTIAGSARQRVQGRAQATHATSHKCVDVQRANAGCIGCAGRVERT